MQKTGGSNDKQKQKEKNGGTDAGGGEAERVSGHDRPVCDPVLYGPLYLRQYLPQRMGAQGVPDCNC